MKSGIIMNHSNNTSGNRIETDSMGTISVPNDKLWGAQTERSLQHFSIGSELMPLQIIYALVLIKKVAAITNNQLGHLDHSKMQLIIDATDSILTGSYDTHFPLHVWMTGSGTQSNMNVNEVIANIANLAAGSSLGSKVPIHPNDHVNMSQSSNDVFPSAIHIASTLAISQKLIPALNFIKNELWKKAKDWTDIVKIGRTHMQDAVPITLGQEFSGYATMIDQNIISIHNALEDLYPLALGGTAVGTGINSPAKYPSLIAKNLSELTKIPFTSANNKFAIQGSHDALVKVSGNLKILANSLFKIANDIRLLSCGPRAGLHELLIPENEPGSSIMPGKVNPTQCEALSMVAIQVIANDVAITLGNASGMLEMNVYKPLIAYNLMQSITILTDAITNFTKFLLIDCKPNQKKIDEFLHDSLMLVTALSPTIGYDKASQLAHYANDHDCSLFEANVALKFVSEAEFKRIVNPYNMTHCTDNQKK